MSGMGSKNSKTKSLMDPGPPFGSPAPGDFLPAGEFSDIKLTRVGSQWMTLIDPQTVAPMLITPTGSLQVAEIIRLVGGNFENGPFLSHLWTVGEVNGGTALQVQGEAVHSTNAQVNARAFSESARRARFVTATYNVSHQGVRLDPFDAGPNNVRRWGCFDPGGTNGANGVFFEVINNEIFVVRRRGGADVAPDGERVAEVDFNGGNTYVKDNDIHIYEIIYNAGSILFMQDRKLIHRMFAFQTVGFNTTHLCIGHDNENINGGNAQASIISRGSSIGRSGSQNAEPDFFRITGTGTFQIKDSPGRLHRIVINSLGVGTAEMTIFNSLIGAGPDIAIIDLSELRGTVNYETDFDQALTAVVTGAGTIDLTVVFD